MFDLKIQEALEKGLDDFYKVWKQCQDKGMTIGTVEEEGGGGMKAVCVNASGVPLDHNGDPLPGGKAPLTEPEAIPSAQGIGLATVAGGVGVAAAVAAAVTLL